MSERPSKADLIRDHVRAVLEGDRRRDEALSAEIDRLHAAGHRVVSSGQDGPDSWTIMDWETRKVIARGTGGYAAYSAKVNELDPNGRFVEYDNLREDIPWEPVETDDLPSVIGNAFQEWIDNPATTNEEIAEWAGWSVEKVHDYR